MGNPNARCGGKNLRTKLTDKSRAWVIKFISRAFNKCLRIVQSGLTPSTVHSDSEEFIQKPGAISIKRPKSANYVRIDIGLSNDASHSAECLLDNDDRLIVGIEPHPENISGLVYGTSKAHSVSLKDGMVRHGFNCKFIPDLRLKFIVIKGAAGSCEVPMTRKFYSAYPDKGNSSLYKIQSPQSTGNITDREFDVTEFPLSDLLEKIKSAGFQFVEALKIDTEGHELEVLKGAGENIRNILFCRVECFKGIYENSRYVKPGSQPAHIILGQNGFHDSATAIIDYMSKYEFRLVSSRPGDYVFLNQALEGLLQEHEVYP
jgi:FkbM family methyltransferase